MIAHPHERSGPARRVPRLSGAVVGLTLTLALLVGPAWPPAAAETAQVRIGIARTMSDVGYYVADAKGYFRDESIAVTMTPFTSAAQMMAPLGVGDLDVAGGTVSAGFYNSVARGINTKIVADESSMKPGYGYSSLMVRKDLVDSGRFKTIADLKGMKVAIGAPGTGTASALNETLKMGGLKYSDVDVVYVGFPEHLPAFLNKGIDAAMSNEPTMTLEIEQGAAVRIVGNDVSYPDQQTAVVFYSERFAKNRDVAERFMRAYIRGIRLYNDALKDGHLAGPAADEIIPILTKYTSIKDPALVRRIIPSAVNPNGEVNLAGLKRDLAFFRELGLIESKDVSADGVVDSSFVKAAVAKLGPYQPAAAK
ncbi:MAG TPA: ABC transporter substrate-binding protein [Xanthobacteraceae bacterium]|nr:ABC transporter substrate-binding protein [Xanthobacteraceae bacterium]